MIYPPEGWTHAQYPCQKCGKNPISDNGLCDSCKEERKRIPLPQTPDRQSFNRADMEHAFNCGRDWGLHVLRFLQNRLPHVSFLAGLGFESEKTMEDRNPGYFELLESGYLLKVSPNAYHLERAYEILMKEKDNDAKSPEILADLAPLARGRLGIHLPTTDLGSRAPSHDQNQQRRKMNRPFLDITKTPVKAGDYVIYSTGANRSSAVMNFGRVAKAYNTPIGTPKLKIAFAYRDGYWDNVAASWADRGDLKIAHTNIERSAVLIVPSPATLFPAEKHEILTTIALETI